MRGTDPTDGQPRTTQAPADAFAGAAAAAGEPDGSSDGAAPSLRSAADHAPKVPAARGQQRPRPIAVTVWRRVDGDVAHAFDTVVPIDLAQAFTGYGPLPAVASTEDAPATWGATAGQSRTVVLTDGARMRETALEVSHPGLFRYEVVPSSGPLRLIVRRIEGRFVFSRSEAGGTVIRWTYLFRPRRGAHTAVRALAPLWRRYAAEVMERLAQAVEADAPAPGQGVTAD